MSNDDLETMCAETARLVMGWTAVELPWAYDGVTSVWHTSDSNPVMTVHSWQPDRNDVQNMQVLDRMTDLGFELVMTVRDEGTSVQFGRGSRALARCENEDRRIAVLRAALAATKCSVE